MSFLSPPSWAQGGIIAEKELKARGVKLAYVAPEEIAEARKLMLAEQETVAREMKISTDMLARISAAIAATN